MLECCKRNESDYQLVMYEEQDRSIACKEQMKIHKIALAVIADIGASATLAMACFDERGDAGDILNPRVYDYINLTLAGTFLLSTALLPSRKLQDPKEAGVCSYEFLATTMIIQTVMYGVVFFNTQDQTDFDRSVIYGFSLGMVSASLLIAACKHVKASASPRAPIDVEEKFFFDSRGEFSDA